MFIEFDTSVGTIRGELIPSELDTWEVRLDEDNTNKLLQRYDDFEGLWANTLTSWVEIEFSDDFHGCPEYKYRLIE